MSQLYKYVSTSGYACIMNILTYYKGDILYFGEDSAGQWFVVGTERI